MEAMLQQCHWPGIAAWSTPGFRPSNDVLMGQVEVSLVPSPTPSFSSLLSTVLSSDEMLGVGLGTRLS